MRKPTVYKWNDERIIESAVQDKEGKLYPLKACPFCGSNTQDWTLSDIKWPMIYCMHCFSNANNGEGLEDAAKWWNTRAEASEEDGKKYVVKTAEDIARIRHM